jgi:hypothetical protein
MKKASYCDECKQSQLVANPLDCSVMRHCWRAEVLKWQLKVFTSSGTLLGVFLS